MRGQQANPGSLGKWPLELCVCVVCDGLVICGQKGSLLRLDGLNIMHVVSCSEYNSGTDGTRQDGCTITTCHDGVKEIANNRFGLSEGAPVRNKWRK